MPSDDGTAAGRAKLLAAALAFLVLYLLLALAALRQWHSPHPWARLDRFSGGYILISLLWFFEQMRWHVAIARSEETLLEASGKSYDPQLLRWTTALSFKELIVFLDYGQLRLVPWLLQPALQWAGAGLYLAGLAWFAWTNSYLIRQFALEPAQRRLMTQGPYRAVRHPRYFALLVSRVAFALMFGSILAWALLMGWIAVIVRRAGLEEEHLRRIFPADYPAYAARTPRLVPGIY